MSTKNDLLLEFDFSIRKGKFKFIQKNNRFKSYLKLLYVLHVADYAIANSILEKECVVQWLILCFECIFFTIYLKCKYPIMLISKLNPTPQRFLSLGVNLKTPLVRRPNFIPCVHVFYKNSCLFLIHLWTTRSFKKCTLPLNRKMQILFIYKSLCADARVFN